MDAQTHLLKSLEIFGEFAVGYDIVRSLTYLGDVNVMTGNFPEAKKIYRDALQLSIEAKVVPIALDAILGLGILYARAGDPERALMLCDYVLNHASSEEETRNRAGQLRAGLKPMLRSEKDIAAFTMEMENRFDVIVKVALETI
jgi:tetratricopeptide (TPR) repeat protein